MKEGVVKVLSSISIDKAVAVRTTELSLYPWNIFRSKQQVSTPYEGFTTCWGDTDSNNGKQKVVKDLMFSVSKIAINR